jgi:hypothetical protein
MNTISNSKIHFKPSKGFLVRVQKSLRIEVFLSGDKSLYKAFLP